MPDLGEVATLAVSAAVVFVIGWFVVSMRVLVVIIIALSLHVYCCYNYYSIKQRTVIHQIIHQLEEANIKLKTWQHTFP